MPKSSQKIEFVRRHTKKYNNTHSAEAAIFRLESIIEAISENKSQIEYFERNCDLSTNRFMANMNEYYIVGIVTCLEWHARTRLVDLLIHDPNEIQANDIGRRVDQDEIIRVATEMLPIQYLIGSAINISNKDAYRNIFERIFNKFKIKNNVIDILDLYNKDLKKDLMKDLFERRNNTVHEVRAQQIGHYTIRDNIQFDELEEISRNILEIIKRIEAEIFHGTPENFPNRYSETQEIKSERTLKEEKIASVERVASSYFEAYKEDQTKYLEVQQALETVMRFLEETPLLSVHRAYDFRTPVILDFMSARIKMMESIFGNTPYK